MSRNYTLLLFLLLLVLSSALRIANAAATSTSHATSTTQPKAADCLMDAKVDAKGAAVSVEYGGKTYYLKSQACKDEFLTDPERYSQLYDALLELKAQGQTLQRPKPATDFSAVPA